MPEKKLVHKNKKPDSEIDAKFIMSRRNFIGGMLAAGAIVSSPQIKAISFVTGDYLNENQLLLIKTIQEILFPSDGEGPGAKDIMADRYLLWVLSDERLDPEERDYIILGISWVEETAEEEYSQSFNKLSQTEKENLIDLISKESWGRSWLGVILNFIFEALLSDPQYGGNPDGIGWQWLNFNAGNPRPSKPLLYPEIVTTIRKRPKDGQ